MAFSPSTSLQFPKKAILGWFVALALLCMLSCCQSKDTKDAKAATLPIVTTMTVEPHDVPVTFEFVAQTQSSHTVNIQARVTGFLDKRLYTEGELVKEGQILFVMDKKPYEAKVQGSRAALTSELAALENARRNLARVKPLAEQKALSQKDLDDATSAFQTRSAAVEIAKSQLETDLLNLSYCTITAPFDGIAGAALQQEGSYLSMASSQLTTVFATSPLWVNFSMSEQQLENLREEVNKGQLLVPANREYVVEVVQFNGELFPNTGKITFSAPIFNPQTGTFLVRASVDNPEGTLWPNQYVRVRVLGAIRPQAIVVPQRAVQQSSQGFYVWVLNKDGQAEMRLVEAGDWHGDGWFITSGLTSGDVVIVDTGAALHAGDKVQIKDTTQEKSQH